MSGIEYIISLDKSVFVFLNNLGSESWDPFWNFVTHRFTWIPFYLYLLFLIQRNKGWKTLGIYILLLAITILIVDQSTTHLFKNVFQRLRPSHDSSLEGLIRITGSKGGLYGFVSAHASNTFAIAMLLGILFKNRYKNAKLYLLLWASFVAYSRIYVGVHYPLDLIFGALWGMLVACIVLSILKGIKLFEKIIL